MKFVTKQWIEMQLQSFANKINSIFVKTNSLSPVSFSGKYNDLSEKPDIPDKLSKLENDTGFAKIESPTFTGQPNAPTPNTDSNDTQIATTAFVKTLISNLINGAPETLDTLKEIADALGENDDAVQALNTAIANKADKSSIPTKISQLTNDSNYQNKTQVNTAIANGTAKTISETLPISKGGTGETIGSEAMKALVDKCPTDSANYNFKDNDSLIWKHSSDNSDSGGYIYRTNISKLWTYVKTKAENLFVKKSGDTMTGALNLANGTWNAVGDDIVIGDRNIAGRLCLMGKTGETGLRFYKKDGSTPKDIWYEEAGNRLRMQGRADVSGIGEVLWNRGTLTNKTGTDYNTDVSGVRFGQAYNSGFPKAYGTVLELDSNNSHSTLFIETSIQEASSAGNVYFKTKREAQHAWSPWERLVRESELNVLKNTVNEITRGGLSYNSLKNIPFKYIYTIYMDCYNAASYEEFIFDNFSELNMNNLCMILCVHWGCSSSASSTGAIDRNIVWALVKNEYSSSDNSGKNSPTTILTLGSRGSTSRGTIASISDVNSTHAGFNAVKVSVPKGSLGHFDFYAIAESCEGIKHFGG